MSVIIQPPPSGLIPVLPHASFVEGRATWTLGERYRDLNARVRIWEDFLRDYIWFELLSSHKGREARTYTPLAEFRVLACSQDEGARLIGEVLDKDVAEHRVYWHSKVWC